MQRDMDKIQFESRAEISKIIEALEESPKQDETVQRMIDLLDVMYMEW